MTTLSGMTTISIGPYDTVAEIMEKILRQDRRLAWVRTIGLIEQAADSMERLGK